MKWEEFLTVKFGLWVDTQSSTNNILHSSVGKSGILQQIEKVVETTDSLLACHMFSLLVSVAYLTISNSCVILVIEE